MSIMMMMKTHRGTATGNCSAAAAGTDSGNLNITATGIGIAIGGCSLVRGGIASGILGGLTAGSGPGPPNPSPYSWCLVLVP